jgi:hypothetical protein
MHRPASPTTCSRQPALHLPLPQEPSTAPGNITAGAWWAAGAVTGTAQRPRRTQGVPSGGGSARVRQPRLDCGVPLHANAPCHCRPPPSASRMPGPPRGCNAVGAVLGRHVWRAAASSPPAAQDTLSHPTPLKPPTDSSARQHLLLHCPCPPCLLHAFCQVCCIDNPASTRLAVPVCGAHAQPHVGLWPLRDTRREAMRERRAEAC